MESNRLIKLVQIFFWPFLVLELHFILALLGVYSVFDWIDIPMHFIGGITIGNSFYLFILLLQRDGFLGRMHKTLFFVFNK